MGLATGKLLIDVDHVIDYVLFERQRDLQTGSFLPRYYLNGKAQRVVLVLHSYELLVLLAAVAWYTNVDWLWEWVIGTLLHLPFDIVFNGKFASSGLVHFYSFIVRARAGFRTDRFVDRRPRPIVADDFWSASSGAPSAWRTRRRKGPVRSSGRPPGRAGPQLALGRRLAQQHPVVDPIHHRRRLVRRRQGPPLARGEPDELDDADVPHLGLVRDLGPTRSGLAPLGLARPLGLA